MKYSIVIPTHNHLNDYLQPCIESIIKYTDLNDIEVIIVANGCTDNTRAYVESLRDPFKLVWIDEPSGYTKSTNEGIKVAIGEYIVLLNNDTVLLPQDKNAWLEILRKPFDERSDIGITGPIKFSWDCGGIERIAIAFWCAMMKKELFNEIGLLDEIFNPGMGEDGDFCIKAEFAGYKNVGVPKDIDFNKDNRDFTFPIFHVGNGTFGEINDIKDEAVLKNHAILAQRYGKENLLETAYYECHNHPSPINEHFPTMRKYAAKCDHVTEFGTGHVFSIFAFMSAKPKVLRTYDIFTSENINYAGYVAKNNNIDFKFTEQSTLEANIEPTDLLFIDTLHTYEQLYGELERHAHKAKKYIMFHDTQTYGGIGELRERPGLWNAIIDFIDIHNEWEIKEIHDNCNGLSVMERVDKIKEKDLSILIHIQGKYDEKFRECIDSVLNSTYLSDKKIIVVANGCDEETREYLYYLIKKYYYCFNYVWINSLCSNEEAYISGLNKVRTEDVILLENYPVIDSSKNKDAWIKVFGAGLLGTTSTCYMEKTINLKRKITNKLIDKTKENNNENNNLGKWNGYHSQIENPTPYGDTTTYLLGANFLKDCETIEDWGCGTCFFSTVIDKKIKYKGIDGSKSKFTNEIADLTLYRSKNKPDGIFIRHVLEHNIAWRNIIENAIKSFNKKMVLVLFTPINTEKTYNITNNEGINVPDISFNIYDILEYLNEYKFNFEELRTDTQYGVEHIFYIQKQDKNIKTSIVIPTYNHLEDALKPCISKVLAATNMGNKEIIVVANGCTDGTRDFLDSLGETIRYIWLKEPSGYIRAVNFGIYSSSGEYVVLLDNDSLLMSQPKDCWIDILEKPFIEDSKVGATGPFAVPYDGLNLILHSGCTMYKKSVLCSVSVFDEIYNPGYLSDSDVSMKIWEAGYKCIDVGGANKPYINGVFEINFPIVHTGLVRTMDKEKDVEIIKRNREILYSRYGEKHKIYDCFMFFNEIDILQIRLRELYDVVDKFIIVESTMTHTGNIKPLNFVENRELFEKYMDKIIYKIYDPTNIETNTWGRENLQREFICEVLKDLNIDDNDIIIISDADEIIKPNIIKEYGNSTDVCCIEMNNYHYNLNCMVEKPINDPKICRYKEFKYFGPCNIRYFQTKFNIKSIKNGGWHFSYMGGYEKIVEKVKSFAHYLPNDPNNDKYLEKENIEKSIKNFKTIYLNDDIKYLKVNHFNDMPKYIKENYKYFENNNWIIDEFKDKNIEVSIVIPTYNHLDDLLKPCIESIIQYTNLNNTEVIIVANGCTDGTKAYVESLGDKFKLIWIDEPSGYTKSTNEGIKVAIGEYIVLLNNDTLLLQQVNNEWIDKMKNPFLTDDKVGITGPLKMHDSYSNHDVMIFFCVMIKRELFDELGLLDEMFHPGAGEDVDFCAKAHKSGYKLVQVPEEGKLQFTTTNIGDFPIWHKDNQSFKDVSDYSTHIVKRNGIYNMKRHNKNIRLNLGSGGCKFVDKDGIEYITVDLYDPRANIICDVAKIDEIFEENSVEIILASHLFEHLNPYHIHDILSVWFKVLKPGGKLIMEMPNIEEVCKQFVTANKGERYGLLNVIYGSVNTNGIGGQDNITSPHLFGWYPDILQDHLWNVGFKNIVFGPEEIPHPPPNFRVSCEK